MYHLSYNEPILHKTGDLPLAWYYVDKDHPRYHMRVHWHRETELLIMREGILHLYVNDEPRELKAGDIAVIGEGVLHGGEAENGVYECVVFDPYSLLMPIEVCKEPLRRILQSTSVIAGEAVSDRLRDLTDALLKSLREESIDPLSVTGCMFSVFSEIGKYDDFRLNLSKTAAGPRAEQVKPALEYIEKNYSGKVTLAELARLTGLSPKYFCRSFRAVVHRSPIDYLNYYRIECASLLLSSTDMSVAEIAQSCGYNDSSFFIKQFRHYKKTTPGKYRSL